MGSPGAELPPELFPLVIGSVEDTNGFLACCLVSSGWHHITLPLLHRCITFSEDERQYDLLQERYLQSPELIPLTSHLIFAEYNGSTHYYLPFMRIICALAPHIITLQLRNEGREYCHIRLFEFEFPSLWHLMLHTSSADLLRGNYGPVNSENLPSLTRISVYNAEVEGHCEGRADHTSSPCITFALHNPLSQVFHLSRISWQDRWELPWTRAAIQGLTLSWSTPWPFNCPPHTTLCCFQQMILEQVGKPFRRLGQEYLCPGSKFPEDTAPGLFADFMRTVVSSIKHLDIRAQLRGRRDSYIGKSHYSLMDWQSNLRDSEFLLSSPETLLSFDSLRTLCLQDTRRGPRSCVAGLVMFDVLQHLTAPCLEELTISLIFYPHHKRGLKDVAAHPRWRTVDLMYAGTTSLKFSFLRRFLIVYMVPMPNLFPEWRKMSVESEEGVHSLLLSLLPNLLSTGQLALSHTAY